MTSLGGFEQLLVAPIVATFTPEWCAFILVAFLFLVALFSKLDFGAMIIFGIAILSFFLFGVMGWEGYAGLLVLGVVALAAFVLVSMLLGLLR